MYKIRRINIPDVVLMCRCYGSQRNQPNHYETLCIQNNSSQKEIRDAFLKLSKELHPDIGNKGSHTEFVKLNEAYKILSKDHSRRQHDMDLKYKSSSAHYGNAYQYSERVYYQDPRSFRPRSKEEEEEFENNYYGIKGLKRVANWKIALLCVTVCVLIVSLELTMIRNSVYRSQKYLKDRSLKAEQHYAQARTTADTMTRDEQIESLRRKYDDENSSQQNFEEINR